MHNSLTHNNCVFSFVKKYKIKVYLGLFIAIAPLTPSFDAEANQGVTSLKEMRERGVVMQQWETSCAAAALATVLTYGFHDPVSERHVAAKMLEKTDPAKVKKQRGFTLLDMKHFVVERGYEGSAFMNLSLSDLKVFRAAIVPINNYGYNHYVVFNGIRGDSVLLADPGFGNREMPIERFEKIWMHGIAFVVTH